MGLSSLLTLILPTVTVIYCLPSPQLTEHGYLRLQPEIDQVDVGAYLKNERLVKLQLRCLLLNQPCDIIGRWLKPRVKAALLGECLVCTKKQQERFDSWLQVVIEKFPQFYRAAVAKYILDKGITLSVADKVVIDKTLSNEEIDKAVQYIKQVNPLSPSKGSNHII